MTTKSDDDFGLMPPPITAEEKRRKAICDLKDQFAYSTGILVAAHGYHGGYNVELDEPVEFKNGVFKGSHRLVRFNVPAGTPRYVTDNLQVGDTVLVQIYNIADPNSDGPKITHLDRC